MSSLMTMSAAISEKQNSQSKAVLAAHRVADSYMRFAEANSANAYEQGVTAQLLCNFAEKHRSYDEGVKAFGRVSDSAFGNFTDGATHEGSFGPWVMDVWPLVVAWYPEFPLKELISVQEMEKPLAWMFFSKLKAGTTKMPTVYGDEVETPLGMRKIDGRYPTGEIFGEEILASNGGFQINGEGQTVNSYTAVTMLSHYPVNLSGDYKDKLLLNVYLGASTTADGGGYKYDSENNGVVIFRKNDESSSPTGTPSAVELDIQTGLLTFKGYANSNATGFFTQGATASDSATSNITKVVVNYVTNLDYATTDNIPRVKEDVEKIEMIARERALMMEWSVFSEYLKKTQFGQDIQQDNLKRVLDLMYQFQVKYILDEMYIYAEGKGNGVDKGSEATISIVSSSVYSIDVTVQKLLQSLNTIANKIEVESGRMAGNRLVVGRGVKAFLESLPNTYYHPVAEPDAFSSAREIGEIGGFKVFFDPFIGDNKGFMTYKGKEWYDAAYYMGMYMPLTTTDTVVLGVSAKQSFVSMEAYKFHKKNCVFKLGFSFS